MHKFDQFVTAVVMIAAVLIWAVVGFIFWIPLLSRAAAVFAAAMLVAQISGDTSAVARVKQFLPFAISFYSTGFRHALGLHRMPPALRFASRWQAFPLQNFPDAP